MLYLKFYVRFYVSVENVDIYYRRLNISDKYVSIYFYIIPMSDNSLQWIDIWNWMLASMNELIFYIFKTEKSILETTIL